MKGKLVGNYDENHRERKERGKRTESGKSPDHFQWLQQHIDRPLIICKGMFLDMVHVTAAKVREWKRMIRVGKAMYVKSKNWQLPKHETCFDTRTPAGVGYYTQVQPLTCTFLSLRKSAFIPMSKLYSFLPLQRTPAPMDLQFNTINPQPFAPFFLCSFCEYSSSVRLLELFIGCKILSTVLQVKTFPPRR